MSQPKYRQVGMPETTPESLEECPPPARATGACIPLAPGSKHKKSMQDKLRPLIKNSPAPSVLAATIMQQMRCYLQGRRPGNDLEASVFEVFDTISQESPGFLSCTMEMFDGLTKRECDSLFAPEIVSVGDQALPPKLIADLFAEELDEWAADAVFDDGHCTEERPVIPRPVFSTINGGAFLGFLARICRVNGLRTFFFEPSPGVRDYDPDELERICTFNVEVTVRLPAKAPGMASAEVEAFVRGDHDTPASDEVGRRILAIPIFADLTPGTPDQPIDFRIDNVVPGDTRDTSRVLIQESGLAGVSIAIFGYEIDSEEAFENEFDSRMDGFIEIVMRLWEAIKEEASAAVAEIVTKYGVTGLAVVLVAAVVLAAIIPIVALWAPADLIIEDHIGLTTVNLASLTNANFPSPQEIEYTSTGGIEVKFTPESEEVQYLEGREYRSVEQDSEYHITLRYNHLS
jgi:hypothetical protein